MFNRDRNWISVTTTAYICIRRIHLRVTLPRGLIIDKIHKVTGECICVFSHASAIVRAGHLRPHRGQDTLFPFMIFDAHVTTVTTSVNRDLAQRTQPAVAEDTRKYFSINLWCLSPTNQPGEAWLMHVSAFVLLSFYGGRIWGSCFHITWLQCVRALLYVGFDNNSSEWPLSLVLYVCTCDNREFP